MALLSGDPPLYQLLRQDERIREKRAPNISSCYLSSGHSDTQQRGGEGQRVSVTVSSGTKDLSFALFTETQHPHILNIAIFPPLASEDNKTT